MVAAEAKEHAEAKADPLSEREHEVLRLLALGHTNQEIAKTLYISVRTAETHRAHIMQKLGLASRAELVRYALDRNHLLGHDVSPSLRLHSARWASSRSFYCRCRRRDAPSTHQRLQLRVSTAAGRPPSHRASDPR